MHDVQDLPRYLDPQRFAEEIGVHRQTVYVMLREGDVPGARKIGQRWKIPRWAVTEVGTPAQLAAA